MLELHKCMQNKKIEFIKILNNLYENKEHRCYLFAINE